MDSKTTDSRELPIGIQDFEKLRTNNYLYVDKTALVYELASRSTHFFLGRPRRFGKSLLLSTFKAYFSGRKDLFEQLAIEKLETEWTEYPVLHISLGRGWYNTIEDLYSRLDKCLQPYEELYDIKDGELAPDRFYGLIRHACQQTGKRVVVLIDEYDKPLLDAIHDDKLEAEYLKLLRGFYSVLKDADQYLRFVFITGITRFSQASVFSGLNQLRDISMQEPYATICGITKEELTHTFTPEIKELAAAHGVSFEKTVDKLTRTYDGYHFCENTPGMFNPFSILNAFDNNKFGYYWFDTGTPSYLVGMLKNSSLDIKSLMGDVGKLNSRAFTNYLANPRDPIPIFYQSGYLTIKGYDKDDDSYTLGFPNDEVRNGFFESLLPIYLNQTPLEAKTLATSFLEALEAKNVDRFIEEFKVFMAGVPYDNNVNERWEGYYQTIFYLAFKLIGVQIETEVRSAIGRADAVVKTKNFIYVFEFKLDGTAKAALKQINDRGYAEQYALDGRPVIKVGVGFSKKKRNVSGYLVQY